MLTARTIAALVLASTVATGCDAWERDGIGPDGGVVVSDDGRMALEVPAGALDRTVEITIEVVAGPEGASSDLYVIQPLGLTFDLPAAVVFDYDDEMLGSADVDALSLVAQREASWSYLPDQRVHADDQTVSASLMALSAVSVVVED